MQGTSNLCVGIPPSHRRFITPVASALGTPQSSVPSFAGFPASQYRAPILRIKCRELSAMWTLTAVLFADVPCPPQGSTLKARAGRPLSTTWGRFHISVLRLGAGTSLVKNRRWRVDVLALAHKPHRLPSHLHLSTGKGSFRYRGR